MVIESFPRRRRILNGALSKGTAHDQFRLVGSPEARRKFLDGEGVVGNKPDESRQEPDFTAEALSFKINDITSAPVTSVAELVDLSELLLPPIPPLQGSLKSWAFRGQPRDYGTLVPSFQRQFSRRSRGTAEIIEQRLIRAFRQHYADLKDRSPDMPFPDQIGTNLDLRCLSVMQHYEIPTRLLDWTSNLWTAIYFACASDPGTQAELWYYDRGMFEQQRQNHVELLPLMERSTTPSAEPYFLGRRSDELITELDPQISPRMKQQEAHHTVSTNAFGDHAPMIFALRKMYSSPEQDLELRRVLIDGSCKSKALQFLAEEKNITASTIFPDVVGLGRFLRWQFESLRTMLL
jgi:hypothetical protein